MMLMEASSSRNEFKIRFKHVICDLHVKIVTLKQVGNDIWKHTYNINTKEWYFTNVTNVLTDHLKKTKIEKHKLETVHNNVREKVPQMQQL